MSDCNGSIQRWSLLLCLHDMIVGEPLELMVTLVDRRWMEADWLIVRAVSEPLSVTYEQLGIETPRNHRARDNIIVAIGIRSLGYVEEQSATTGKSSSGKLASLHGEGKLPKIPLQSSALNFCQRKKSGIHNTDDKLTLQILNIWQGLLTVEVLFAELIFRATSKTDSFPCQVGIVNRQ